MNEIDYLDKSIEDNMKAIKSYVEKGYLNWGMLEVDCEDRLYLINNVFPNTLISDPIKVLGDFENSYIAALRVIGDKSEELFNQLDNIRSGNIWKKNL